MLGDFNQNQEIPVQYYTILSADESCTNVQSPLSAYTHNHTIVFTTSTPQYSYYTVTASIAVHLPSVILDHSDFFPSSNVQNNSISPP